MTTHHLKKSGIPSDQTASRVSRRELLRNLAAAAGAGAAWPYIAASHPVYKHLCDAETLAEADAALSSKNWKPQFLSLEQSNTLLALSEAIVPGSAKAQAHRFIDLLLSVDTAKNQEGFVQALNALDAESTARFAKSLRSLNPAQLTELLTVASTMDGLRKASGDESSTGHQPRNLRDHFDDLKGWVSGAYYSSEPGMAELGWTGARVFAKFPECAHPGEHI